MRVFITGGCKNGKSYYAQSLARAQAAGRCYYIATMLPADAEDEARIARHRRERDGWGFVTIEQPSDIDEILEKCGACGSFLLDSVTALLANEMFSRDGTVNEAAGEKVSAGLRRIIGAIENIVVVSDYIYGDAGKYDALTERYRKGLALADRTAAESCEAVLEVAYGGITAHKRPGSWRPPDFGGIV